MVADYFRQIKHKSGNHSIVLLTVLSQAYKWVWKLSHTTEPVADKLCRSNSTQNREMAAM